MKQGPHSFDVEALLRAAGVDRPSMKQRQDVRRALALFARTVCPRTHAGRDRWRKRATYLRDRHAPHLDWGDAELNEGPDA